MRTFEDRTQEELYFRKAQLNQYSHAYHVTAFCPCEVDTANRNIITRAILENEEDADIHFTRMSGSVMSPVDINGQRETTAVPTFLAAGVTAGRNDRGQSVRITNLSRGIDLTARFQDPQAGATLRNDFIPLELLLTPGYGTSFYKPAPFDYFLARNEKLLFEFRNRDILAGVDPETYGARVSMVLIGQRIER